MAGQGTNAQARRGGWHSLFRTIHRGGSFVLKPTSFVTGVPRSGDLTIQIRNAKPSASNFIMNKQDFKDTLQHGNCQGSREFLSPTCRSDNPGKQPVRCPLDIEARTAPERLCNCCSSCRNSCDWTAKIKAERRKERQRQMTKVTEYLDNE